MADNNPPIETVAILDKSKPVEQPADKSALDKIMSEVYKDMATIGLGPLYHFGQSDSAPSADLLPKVDIFDDKKFPVTTSNADTSQPGHLDLPFKLEPPAITVEGEGYTVAVAPVVDPFKQTGGVKVSGTF